MRPGQLVGLDIYILLPKVTRKKHDFKHPNLVGREVAPVLPYSIVQEMMEMPGSKRLMIVRHPFDRLVSAFRDKLERKNGMYYNLYGKTIVEKYRGAALKKFGEEFFSAENNFGALYNLGGARTKELPSWWEFVQWILANGDHPERYDEHWKPMSLFCSVCTVPYNFILHFENLEREEQLLVDLWNVSGIVSSRWENRNDRGLAKKEIRDGYLGLLDRKEVDQLYELYKDDFLLFGYTI